MNLLQCNKIKLHVDLSFLNYSWYAVFCSHLHILLCILCHLTPDFTVKVHLTPRMAGKDNTAKLGILTLIPVLGSILVDQLQTFQ